MRCLLTWNNFLLSDNARHCRVQDDLWGSESRQWRLRCEERQSHRARHRGGQGDRQEVLVDQRSRPAAFFLQRWRRPGGHNTVCWIWKKRSGLLFNILLRLNLTRPTSQVITGWDQGLLGMQIGEERKLTIPADEGYGAAGFPAWGIPPNGTLEFTLEVLKIEWGSSFS